MKKKGNKSSLEWKVVNVANGQKKEAHYGKREDLGNRSTDTHTRRDPMLENTVVEL